MGKTKFVWSNLPRDKVVEFKLNVFNDMKKNVLQMHNHYKLSPYDYGCCGLSSLMKQCWNAIEKV